MNQQDIVIVGAGAAGCFAAAICGELNPSLKIQVLEKTRQPLAKVRVSGGGRCNVTHHNFDPSFLIDHYPRGREFLRGLFHRFQPRDMIQWLLSQGVELKIEPDGRMFPKSNRSETIIDCFLRILERHGTVLSLESEVVDLLPLNEGFLIRLKNGTEISSKQVLFATGGVQKSADLLRGLGLKVEPGIPSLFTFEVKEEWIKALSGSVASQAKVSIEGFSKELQGPVLITHFGLSGPAVLKLSAFAAQWLYDQKYQAIVRLNWTGLSKQQIFDQLFLERKKSGSKKLILTPLFSLSKNMWKTLLHQVSLNIEEKNWSQISREELGDLAKILGETKLSIIGKSLNKEEFVTCGGVVLDEVHPKTLESKKIPGLHFAGEALHIDGVTGGFNFQSAWTTGYLAAHSMVENLSKR